MKYMCFIKATAMGSLCKWFFEFTE